RLSDLVAVQQALDQLSGNPGPAAAPPRGRAPTQRRAAADDAPPAAPDEKVVGRLRRLKGKLKSGRKGTDAPRNGPRPPEGMDDLKYRQLLACADDPETARAAMEDGPLRKALAKADSVLGLNPVRLERVTEDTAPEGDGADEQETDGDDRE
ncbi:MAG: hypothetical protein V3S00_02920, partial [Dehalococcoidia bacterium]